MDFYQDNLFKQLLRDLITEPYSKERLFHLKDLESITQEILKDSEALRPDHPTHLSLDRAKSVLCLILSHLELSGSQELPKGALTTYFGTEFSNRSMESPILTTLDFLQNLKLTGQFPAAPTHLDKLLAQQLCMHVESQCDFILNEVFSLKSKSVIFQSCFVESKEGWSLSPSLETFLIAPPFSLEKANFSLFQTRELCLQLAEAQSEEPPQSLCLIATSLLLALFSKMPLVFSEEKTWHLIGALFGLEQKKQQALTWNFMPPPNWFSKLEKQCEEVLLLLEFFKSLKQEARRAA